jgi:hypothetical protein
MILHRASLSTLRGMNVLNESLAMCESAIGNQHPFDAHSSVSRGAAYLARRP